MQRDLLPGRLHRLAAIVPLAAATAAADVIHVDDDSPVNGPGTSWNDAFSSLQDAIAASEPGDLIKVAGGIYFPDLGTGIAVGDRNAWFVPKASTILEGSYAGLAGGDPESRSIVATPTILDGDIGVEGPTSDNSRKLLYLPPDRVGVTIDGFVVRNGNADENTPLGRSGGGIQVSADETTIRRCIVHSNVAGFVGGGIRVSGPSQAEFLENVRLENCLVVENATDGTPSPSDGGGGGIYVGNGRLHIVNSTVDGNTVSGTSFTDSDALFANPASDTGEAIVVNSILRGDGNAIRGLSVVTATFSNTTPLLGGVGNLDVDPDYGVGYRLATGSPCIDAGSNAAVPPGSSVDLDGAPRITDGDCADDGAVVDVGAYEADPRGLVVAWNGGALGRFGAPRDWDPVGVPRICDTAYFDEGGSTATVRVDEVLPVGLLYVESGSILFEFQDGDLGPTTLEVQGPGATVELATTTGATGNYVGESIVVGNVNGADAALTVGLDDAAGLALVLDDVIVGDRGDGLLEVQPLGAASSTTLQVDGALLVGIDAGVDGTIEIAGGGTLHQTGTSGRSTNALTIGEGGAGEIRLAGSGGTLRTDAGVSEVVIGALGSGQGLVQVLGPSSTWELDAGDRVIVGAEGGGEVRVLGGGTIASSIGGGVGEIVLGESPDASATVRISGAGSSWVDASGAVMSIGGGGVSELIVENGGLLEVGQLTVRRFGTITEDGTISLTATIPRLTAFGTIVPDGVLTVSGDYRQQPEAAGDPAGVLRATLPATAAGPGSGDRLVVTGLAEIAGGIELDAPPGFDPAVGETFDLLTAGTVEGVFDVAFLPGLSSDETGDLRFLKVNYQDGTGPAGGDVVVSVESLEQILGLEDASAVGLAGTPTGVAVADLDGVNGDDLAITLDDPADGTVGDLVVLLNDGTGTGYAQVVQLTVGLDPADVAAGDLDGDGALDLAVANTGSDDVSITLNPGNGLFTTTGTTSVGDRPVGIAIARIYGGDLDADVVVSRDGEADDAAVALLQGDGAGGVTVVEQILLPALPPGFFQRPSRPDPADLDDDKDADIVLALGGSGQVVRIVNGFGFDFSDVDVLPAQAGTADTDVRDLDGDGLAEIVAVNRDAGTVSVIRNQTIAADEPVFAPTVNLPVGANPRTIVAVDLDGDGAPNGDADLAVLSDDGSGTPQVEILRNDSDVATGGGVVLAPAEVQTVGAGAVLLAAGDLDQTGAADLVTIDQGLGGPMPQGAGAPGGGGFSVVLNDPATGPPPCPQDLDGDGAIAFGDLLIVLSAWGNADDPADIDESGLVDFADVLSLLSAWGPCPE